MVSLFCYQWSSLSSQNSALKFVPAGTGKIYPIASTLVSCEQTHLPSGQVPKSARLGVLSHSLTRVHCIWVRHERVKLRAILFPTATARQARHELGVLDERQAPVDAQFCC